MSNKSHKSSAESQVDPSTDDQPKAEIDAGSVIITPSIILLATLGFFWIHLQGSDISEADVAPIKATENEITLVVAVEMNGCSARNTDCYIYVAGDRSSFLRLVLGNGDDYPMPVRRGTIHDLAEQMGCTGNNQCEISTTRDDESRVVTVELATSSLSQYIQLVVPLLGDED